MKEVTATQPDEANQPLLVTVDRFCDLTGLRTTTAYKLINEGAIESLKIGRRRLIKYASVKRLVEAA